MVSSFFVLILVLGKKSLICCYWNKEIPEAHIVLQIIIIIIIIIIINLFLQQ